MKTMKFAGGGRAVSPAWYAQETALRILDLCGQVLAGKGAGRPRSTSITFHSSGQTLHPATRAEELVLLAEDEYRILCGVVEGRVLPVSTPTDRSKTLTLHLPDGSYAPAGWAVSS